jgi:hypothetical protein
MLLSLAVAVLLSFPSVPASSQGDGCATASACRDAALEVAAREDFEAFHDLAWRAVQKGRRNDPELMLLLARAQSLSGRPADALVMLQRLTALGVKTGADVSDDFRRVRALPGWSDLERAMATAGPLNDVSAAAPPASAATPDPPDRPAAPIAPAKAAPVARPAADTGAEALRFVTPPFTPAGLAYDSVSRRFIVGDRQARKLAVVDEFSHKVANLAGAQFTGFGEVTALEIDPREGNLWVVSADGDGDAARTTLHKLQLISGRALASYAPTPPRAGRFADVAVTRDGTVVVVDDVARRLLRLRPRAAAMESAASLGDITPTSVAPAPDAVVYVAHADGIVRVDPQSRRVTKVRGAADVDLSGFGRIRWHGGGLVGIQKKDQEWRAVRVTLNRDGTAAASLEVLDPSVTAADPRAAHISGDALYYLSPAGGGEMVIRRVQLSK